MTEQSPPQVQPYELWAFLGKGLYGMVASADVVSQQEAYTIFSQEDWRFQPQVIIDEDWPEYYGYEPIKNWDHLVESATGRTWEVEDGLLHEMVEPMGRID